MGYRPPTRPLYPIPSDRLFDEFYAMVWEAISYDWALMCAEDPGASKRFSLSYRKMLHRSTKHQVALLKMKLRRKGIDPADVIQVRATIARPRPAIRQKAQPGDATPEEKFGVKAPPDRED